MLTALEVLQSRCLGISPEAKYVLAYLANSFSTPRPFAMSAEILADRLGLSSVKAGRALRGLVDAELLKLSSVSTEKRPGRPKGHYLLSLDKLASLDAGTVAIEHAQALFCLLWGDKELRSGRRGDALSFIDRLLLAVMLCRADSFGVVSGTSESDLVDLVGINSERIHYSLTKLTRLHVLWGYIPGLSHSLVSKVTGTYFINLNHFCLKGAARGYGAIVFRDKKYSLPYNEMPPWRRYSSYEIGRKAKAGEKKKHRFGGNERYLGEYIEWRLSVYASYFLSNHYSCLSLTGSGYDTFGVKDMVRSDFVAPVDSDVASDENSSPSQEFDQFIDGLVGFSYGMAVSVKRMLCEVKEFESLAVRELLVFPVFRLGKSYNVMTILVRGAGVHLGKGVRYNGMECKEFDLAGKRTVLFGLSRDA